MKKSSDKIRIFPILTDIIGYCDLKLLFIWAKNTFYSYIFLSAILLISMLYTIPLSTLSNTELVVFPMLALIPAVSYSIDILQTSVRGMDATPSQKRTLPHLRRGLEVGILLVFWWFSLKAIAYFVLSFISPVLSPINLYISNDTNVMEELRYIMSIALTPQQSYIISDYWELIDINYHLFLGFYATPFILGSYSERERFFDFLSIQRVRASILTKDYAILGIIAVVLWITFLYLGSNSLSVLYKYFDLFFLKSNFAKRFIIGNTLIPLWLYNPLYNLIYFIPIAIMINIKFAAPFYIVARITGVYWHIIEPDQGERKLLVDTTKQLQLSYYAENQHRISHLLQKMILIISEPVGVWNDEEDDESDR
ncbi:hypothetical protein [Halomicrococcus sp. NG-SE-24]|uniref:hypothetical protein n=1 Tax=Halomicrococcus sp. NG-SE-24 TaxID=3436928 RepID=UPI003D96DDF7